MVESTPEVLFAVSGLGYAIYARFVGLSFPGLLLKGK